MGKYIVLDIVFHGNSLNYDQGSGNYQELKKITKWDGRQYTLVSRYALRYSLLETAQKANLFKLTEAENLIEAGKGENKVIQPATEFLLTGDILNYPEFDLFGYLITDTSPQNFRVAPVKISHAVSMTPFMYDAHFNANIGLANRMRKMHGEMKPNPFTMEEHETYYQYTVVVDIGNIGEMEVYIKPNTDVTIQNEKFKVKNIEKINALNDEEKLSIKLKKGRNEKDLMQSDIVELSEFTEFNDVYLVKYKLKDNKMIKERILSLIKALMNLKRSIKGREEDLSPKLLIAGVYNDGPYKTYRDKIVLVDEYVEEEYDEIEETKTENGRILKVKHKSSKTRKPLFKIKGIKAEITSLDEDKVLSFVERIFHKEDEYKDVKVFKDESIEVKI
ncbi:MAG: type I-B CRISPR-associated protein Cas7/Cst2/DevR [Candidatus Aenigmatarchaeota archaeon]|nr:type I-B CRISPR-associated protein Cas7/Cst2/DevR [Methanothermobacter sp.]